jgi:hypothetical protein
MPNKALLSERAPKRVKTNKGPVLSNQHKRC